MNGGRYVVSLALGRLARRRGGALGAALGIAAAAAVLAGVLVGGTVAQDRSVAQDVDRLAADTRAVRASWFGVPAGPDEAWSPLDRAATAALERLPAPAPTRIALVRESTIAGAFVGLAAVDGLGPHVLLRSGRLPASLPTGSLRGAASPGPWAAARRPGTARRGGRDGDAALAPALRRLSRTDRQRARRRRARARARSGRGGTTARRPGRSSSPRELQGSCPHRCSRARTAATAGCSRSPAGRRACGRSTGSSEAPTGLGPHCSRARPRGR